MVKITISIVVVCVILLGIYSIGGDIIAHARKRKILSGDSIKLRFLLLVIGISIIADKLIFL